MTREQDEAFWRRWQDEVAPLWETMDYADDVVSKMPRDTPEQRRERANRYAGILSEWHAARRRWNLLRS